MYDHDDIDQCFNLHSDYVFCNDIYEDEQDLEDYLISDVGDLMQEFSERDSDNNNLFLLYELPYHSVADTVMEIIDLAIDGGTDLLIDKIY